MLVVVFASILVIFAFSVKEIGRDQSESDSLANVQEQLIRKIVEHEARKLSTETPSNAQVPQAGRAGTNEEDHES